MMQMAPSMKMIMNLCNRIGLIPGQPSGCFYIGIIDAKTVLRGKELKVAKNFSKNEYIPCGCGESISIKSIEISII